MKIFSSRNAFIIKAYCHKLSCYLDVVEVTVVRLHELISRELNVNLEARINLEHPGAVNRDAVGLGMRYILLGDVGMALKIVNIQKKIIFSPIKSETPPTSNRQGGLAGTLFSRGFLTNS